MTLPNAHVAIVAKDKIVDYLLDSTHPDGASKATFFKDCGFEISQWQSLAEALGQLAREADVASTMETVHGQKYIVDGTIETPDGTGASVRTIWIVDHGKDVPRLVTAYPFRVRT